MSTNAETGDRRTADLQRLTVAALIPLMALGLQWAFWIAIQPHVWLLFYPAVFFSSWVGGLRGGLVATGLSTGLVWYFFIPPQFSFALQRPMALVSIATFAGMGVLFSFFHGRLRKANQQATEAFAAVQSLNDQLEARILARTADLQKTNESLLDNRARLDAALASMADAVFISDTQGRFIEFNEAFATFHKFSSKAECAKTLAEYPVFLDVFLPNGDLAALEQWAVPRALRGETVANAEYTLRRKDTGETWVGSYSFAPIRNQDGVIVGAVVTGRDITERRRVEQELRASVSRLKVAGRMGRFGAWSVKLADGRVQWSEEVAAIHETPPEFSPSLTEGLAFYAPEWRERISTVFDACARDGKPYDEEMQIITARGQRVWVRTIGEAVRDAAGTVIAVQGAFQDITARKRLEESLLESERKYTLLFEKSAIPTVLLRLPEVVIVEVNEACERLTGFTRQEMSGRTAVEVGLTNKDARQEAISRFAHQGALEGLEMRLSTKSGGERIVVSNTNPVQIGVQMHALTTMQDITERKQAEEALRESEARLRLSVQSANIGLWDWNLKTNTVYFSPEWKRQIGCRDDEISNLFEEWQRRVHPDDLEPMLQKVRDYVAAPQGRHEVEFRFQHKDGSYRWIYAIADMLRAADGTPVRMLGCHLDITERKRAEEALQESEAKFRTLADFVPQMVWMCTPDGLNIYFNQRWVDYTGMSLDESCGRGWNTPFHGDDKQRAWDAWNHAVATGEAYQVESRLRAADGSYRWFLMQGRPLRNASGTVVKWFGTCTDIEEMKQAAAALCRQSERLRNLHDIDRAVLQAVESPERIAQAALQRLRKLLACQRASVGIFDLAKKEVRVFAAEATRETIVQTGKVLAEDAYGDLEVLRQGSAEILEDTAQVKSPSAVAQILQAEGVRSSLTLPLVSERGLIGALNVGWETPRAVTSEEQEIAGEVAGLIALAIQQARLLQETKFHAGELEQRVRERTVQLESANKELEAFSYSVSHDLRAPLRHVQGYVEMLTREAGGQLSDKARRFMKTIGDASAEMGVLIDDLLEFSRMGRTEMCEARVDLEALVRETVRELEPATRERSIIWETSPLPAVQGDSAMLKQVLANLLGNAVKYTRPRDPAKIEIGCAGAEDERTVLYVRDNGVGFDPQYVDKLFGVFQRLHRADEFEGTGIGLASVRRIIARHGGRTWAEGNLNAGATFYFTLKMAPAGEPSQRTGEEP